MIIRLFLPNMLNTKTDFQFKIQFSLEISFIQKCSHYFLIELAKDGHFQKNLIYQIGINKWSFEIILKKEILY